jgi:hypothetical protein
MTRRIKMHENQIDEKDAAALRNYINREAVLRGVKARGVIMDFAEEHFRAEHDRLEKKLLRNQKREIANARPKERSSVTERHKHEHLRFVYQLDLEVRFLASEIEERYLSLELGVQKGREAGDKRKPALTSDKRRSAEVREEALLSALHEMDLRALRADEAALWQSDPQFLEEQTQNLRTLQTREWSNMLGRQELERTRESDGPDRKDAGSGMTRGHRTNRDRDDDRDR